MRKTIALFSYLAATRYYVIVCYSLIFITITTLNQLKTVFQTSVQTVTLQKTRGIIANILCTHMYPGTISVHDRAKLLETNLSLNRKYGPKKYANRFKHLSSESALTLS